MILHLNANLTKEMAATHMIARQPDVAGSPIPPNCPVFRVFELYFDGKGAYMHLFLCIRAIIAISSLLVPLRCLGIGAIITICSLFVPLSWLGNSLSVWAIITISSLLVPLSWVGGDGEGQGGGDDDGGDTHVGGGELEGWFKV